MENEDRSDLLAALLHDLLKQVEELRREVEAFRSEKERREYQKACWEAVWYRALYADEKYMLIATRKEDREKAKELERNLSGDEYVRAFRRCHTIPEGGFPTDEEMISWIRERGWPDAESYEEGVIPATMWGVEGRRTEEGKWEYTHVLDPHYFHFLAHSFKEELDEFIIFLRKKYRLRGRWHSPLRVYVMTGKLDPPPTKIPAGEYAWVPEFEEEYGEEVTMYALNSELPEDEVRKAIDSVPEKDGKDKYWRAAVGDALYKIADEKGCLRGSECLSIAKLKGDVDIVGKRVRVGGVVNWESMQRDEEPDTLRFTLEEEGDRLVVVYQGLARDAVKATRAVILVGEYTAEGIFHTDTILPRRRPLSDPSSVRKVIEREMIRRVRLWRERGVDWTVLEWKEGSDDAV